MTQFAVDSFTGADNTQLEAYNSAWAKFGGGAVNYSLSGNRVKPASSSGTQYFHSATPPSADYSVSCDLYRFDTFSVAAGPVARATGTSVATHYHVRYSSSAGAYQLYKYIAGVATQLGSNATAAFGVGETHNLRLEVAGSSIAVYLDGAATPVIGPVADTAITAAGYAGLRSASASGHFDNFSAATAATTSSVSADLAAAWAVRAPVAADLAAAWSVGAPVAQDLGAAWAVTVPVSAGLSVVWQVQAAGQVAADLAAAWSVRAAVAQDLASAWVVRAPVAADLVAAWSVAARVTRDLPATWLVESVASGDTAFVQLQRRLVGVFKAAPALAGGNIRSNRDAPLGPRETHGVRVYLLGSDPDGYAFVGAPQDWTTTWRVDCLTRAADADADTDPTDAADELLRAAWARAAALQVDDLGAWDVQLAHRIRWDSAEAETAVCAPHFFVQVQHRTDPVTLQPVA